MLYGTTASVYSWDAVPGSGEISSPTADFVSPDSTPLSVSASAGGDRKLSAQLEASQVGTWQVTWSATGEDSAQFVERDAIPVTWTDLLAQVRAIMGTSASQLTERKFNSLVGPLLTCTLDDYADEVGPYGDLPLDQAIMFDGALSYLTAAFLRSSVAPGTASAQVAQITTGTDTVKYFNRYQAIASDPYDEWLQRGFQLLMCMDGFADFANLGADGVFVAAGRRRHIRSRLGLSEPSVPMYDIYRDERIGYDYRSDLFVLTAP